jgi:hypothetical protein
MNVSMGFNPGNFSSLSSVSMAAKITHQAAIGGGLASARDSVQRVSTQKACAKVTGANAMVSGLKVAKAAAKVGKKGKA